MSKMWKWKKEILRAPSPDQRKGKLFGGDGQRLCASFSDKQPRGWGVRGRVSSQFSIGSVNLITSEIILVTTFIISIFLEPDFEELEIPQKYRPRDFQSTCQATGWDGYVMVILQLILIFSRFSPASLRRLYRGFKTECPSGLMTEEAFREVFAKFFPNGGENDDQLLHHTIHHCSHM